ncbi:MAG: hypothetical protein KIS92_25450 [Planctomycetota bacterium]|nr:hypothetical protein [Planctomycetota bacterium]
MAIIVYCKDCGKKIRVPDGPPGRHGRCPQCQAQVAIPAESETAPPPAAHLKKAAVERAEKAKAAGTSLGEDAPTPPEAQKAVAVEEPPAPKPAPKLDPKPAKEKPVAAPKPAAEPDAEAQSAAPAGEAPEPKPAKAPAAKADAPKLRAPTGKPARIALDLKQVEKAAIEEKSEKASNHARAKGSAVVEQHGGISWDTSPDPAPSRAPYVLAAITAVLIGLGYGAWYFFLRSEAKRMSPEERKRLQFEVPAAKDEIKQLQEALPPPPAAKTPPAEAHKSNEAPPPAEKSAEPAPTDKSGENP